MLLSTYQTDCRTWLDNNTFTKIGHTFPPAMTKTNAQGTIDGNMVSIDDGRVETDCARDCIPRESAESDLVT